MPDLNDFHAFKSTSSGSSGGTGGGSGCLKPLIITGIIAIILMLIGKCAA